MTARESSSESSKKRHKNMRSRLRRCKRCGEYTLKEECPKCGARAVNPTPARFSPEDRYGPYRRKMRKKNREE